MFLLMLAVSLLPAIVLFIYIWKKDIQKEPTTWLVKSFLYGVVIIIPVVAVESVLKTMFFGVGGEPSNLFETAVMAFFVAAVPEESFKLLILWLVLRKNPFFDEHFDGIVYAVCIGLGFAAIENIAYVFSHENWLPVAVSRALLAVPGHYAFAILMGYYYSIYHFVDHSPRTAACILLVPLLAHGVYDAIAFSGALNPYFGALSMLILIFFCIRLHKFAKTKILAQIERDKNSYNA